MALTAAQRRRLPDSAFVYPSTRKYPVPTKAQAKRAGISERQRLAIHRNALSRAAQAGTSGSVGRVKQKVKARAGGKIQSVKGGQSKTRTRASKRRAAPKKRKR